MTQQGDAGIHIERAVVISPEAADLKRSFDRAMGTTGKTDWVETDPDGAIVLGLTVAADGELTWARGTRGPSDQQPPTRVLVFIHPASDEVGPSVRFQAIDTVSDRILLSESATGAPDQSIGSVVTDTFDAFTSKDTPSWTRRLPNGMPVEYRHLEDRNGGGAADSNAVQPAIPPTEEVPPTEPIPTTEAVASTGGADELTERVWTLATDAEPASESVMAVFSEQGLLEHIGEREAEPIVIASVAGEPYDILVYDGAELDLDALERAEGDAPKEPRKRVVRQHMGGAAGHFLLSPPPGSGPFSPGLGDGYNWMAPAPTTDRHLDPKTLAVQERYSALAYAAMVITEQLGIPDPAWEAELREMKRERLEWARPGDYGYPHNPKPRENVFDDLADWEAQPDPVDESAASAATATGGVETATQLRTETGSPGLGGALMRGLSPLWLGVAAVILGVGVLAVLFLGGGDSGDVPAASSGADTTSGAVSQGAADSGANSPADDSGDDAAASSDDPPVDEPASDANNGAGASGGSGDGRHELMVAVDQTAQAGSGGLGDVLVTVTGGGQSLEAVTWQGDPEEIDFQRGRAFFHLAPGTYEISVTLPGGVTHIDGCQPSATVTIAEEGDQWVWQARVTDGSVASVTCLQDNVPTNTNFAPPRD